MEPNIHFLGKSPRNYSTEDRSVIIGARTEYGAPARLIVWVSRSIYGQPLESNFHNMSVAFGIIRPDLNLGTRSGISLEIAHKMIYEPTHLGKVQDLPYWLDLLEHQFEFGVSDSESPRGNCAQDDIQITLFQILVLIFGLVCCHNAHGSTPSVTATQWDPSSILALSTLTHPLTSAPLCSMPGWDFFFFTMNQSYWNSGSALLNCGQ